ncbi:MAG: hypothetical protein ABJP34_10000 [Erythrobacter sp.]
MEGQVQKLKPNEVEAANRGEVTAILIRLGYQVYRPEADVGGVDLLVRKPCGKLLDVQLKGRLTVNFGAYGGDPPIWMLFPHATWKFNGVRRWFLVPHNHLYAEMEKRHGKAKGWRQAWSVSTPAKAVLEFLGPYEIGKGRA